MVNPITNPKTNTEMTDFKSVLKSNIQSVELEKKKVKITCANKNAGNKVITTLSQNVSILGSNNYDVKKGIDGAKDFTIKYDGKNGKAEAEAFYNNIMDIINDQSVVTTEAEESGFQKFKENAKNAAQKVGNTVKGLVEQKMSANTAVDEAAPTATALPEPANITGEETSAGSDNKKIMIIGGAVAVVLVLGIVLWLKK